MNFSNLIERVFHTCGYPDSANNRRNGTLQQVMDAINTAYDEICGTCAPELFALEQEGGLLLDAAGTTGDGAGYNYTTVAVPQAYNGEYYLNDWVGYPLAFWTEGQFSHRVEVRRHRNAIRDGLRSTQFVPMSFGPWTLSWVPRSRFGRYEQAAGASTGATAAEAATTVTFGSSSNNVGSGNIGQMLRLNGEDGDYKVVSINNTHSLEVDRPIRSRMDGSMTATGTGAGYAAVRWQLSPPGAYRIKIMPPPNEASILYYSYIPLPRILLNLTDTPEIQRKFHDLIWKGAIKNVAAQKQNANLYGTFINDFDQAIERFKRSDIDEKASDDGPRVETLTNQQPQVAKLPGIYARYDDRY